MEKDVRKKYRKPSILFSSHKKAGYIRKLPDRHVHLYIFFFFLPSRVSTFGSLETSHFVRPFSYQPRDFSWGHKNSSPLSRHESARFYVALYSPMSPWREINYAYPGCIRRRWSFVDGIRREQPAHRRRRYLPGNSFVIGNSTVHSEMVTNMGRIRGGARGRRARLHSRERRRRSCGRLETSGPTMDTRRDRRSFVRLITKPPWKLVISLANRRSLVRSRDLPFREDIRDALLSC